jgi:hypothetical protein
MDEDIENCYGFYIITSSLETEFIRESQVIIVQIWKLEGIGKTFEEELRKLASVLIDGYG